MRAIAAGRKPGLVAALMALAAAGLVALLVIAEPLALRALRDIVFDGYQRLGPRPFAADMPARIVDIDDESLEKFGQWPWPRTLLAQLVGAVGAQAPAVIALDIVLSEPDRTSPARLIGLLPPSPARQALAAELAGAPSSDATLAAALAPLPAVSGIVLAQNTRPVPVRGGFASAGDDPLPFLPRFSGAISPVEEIAPAFKGFGALNWVPEYDLVVRRVPAVLDGGGRLVPSLAVEALRVAQQAGSIVVKASNASGEAAFGARSGIVSLKVGAVVIPTEADGTVRLRYAGARAERRIPAWKVLTGAVPRGEIEGRLVFVGASASALADHRATPLDAAVPGVEIHAEMVEHALGGHRLARPDWARGAEAVATVLAAALAALAALRLAPLAGAGVTALLMAGLVWGSWRLFAGGDLLLDPLPPAFAAAFGFALPSLARWKASEAERHAIRAAFGHYLAPALVERLAAAPGNLRLGGERRTLTILFADVRGFTNLAETLKDDPEALTALMNRLMTPLSRAILETDGTIDKYIGDAVMAFWNAPLDVADHPARAAAAALAMRKELARLNAALAAGAARSGRAHVPIDIGIGINTGETVVGNMGSDVRFDYSALGDPVNLASRLEEETQASGAQILLGETTAEAVRDRFAVIPIGRIPLRGKKAPVALHALLGDEAMRRSAEFGQLAAGIEAALAAGEAHRWDDALAGLAAIAAPAAALGASGCVAAMTARIRARQARPPESGEGLIVTDDNRKR